MSNMQQFVCDYCGRADFKSARGLSQHQSYSRTCNPETVAGAHLNTVQAGQDDAVTDTSILDNTGNNLDISGMSIDDKSNNTFDMPGDDGSASMVNIYDFQDDDSWGLGASFEVDTATDEPAAQALRRFKEYVAHIRDHTTEFSLYEKSALKLMHALRKKGATLDTYDIVLRWHLEECGDENPQAFISRHTMINMLAKRYNVPTDYLQQRQILLPSTGTKVNLIYHDARTNVISLLTDPRFSDDDYLHFDNDPLAPPPDAFDYVADINTGRSYRETYKKLITKPGKQMLVPLILYIDGAITGQFDKLSVEALKMCLGIMNRPARDRQDAWRILGTSPIILLRSAPYTSPKPTLFCPKCTGYVPNYSAADSRGKKLVQESGHGASYLLPIDEDEGLSDASDEVGFGETKYDLEKEYEIKDSKAQDLHRILAGMLTSYLELQDEGLIWDYKYRGKVYKNLELVFFVAFVKCDGDEADKLTGHYSSRGLNVSCVCRYCVCPMDYADDHHANYPLRLAEKIKALVERNAVGRLQMISQQNIKNCFDPVRFGLHNGMGIHGACPMELLHHILLGIYKYCRDQFFIQIGRTSKPAKDINALAKIIGRLMARQSDRDLPKTNFAKGIFEGKIMGKEFSGVLLVMAALLQIKMSKKILAGARGKKFGKQDLIDDWAMLVETLLEWEAYLKLEQMEMKHVVRLKKKNQYLMFLIKKVMKRTKGVGFKFMKFHGILHLVMDIINFGVPNNVDTGANESHHKLVKLLSKRTQKDASVFEKQTAQQLIEYFLLDLAMAELEGKTIWEYFVLDQDRGPLNVVEKPDVEGQTEVCGSEMRVRHDEEDEDGVGWQFAKQSAPTGSTWQVPIQQFLLKLQDEVQQHGVSVLKIRSEHKRSGQIFRAHPNYRRKGQWNDWAIFDWGQYGKLPCEIWCFVDFTDVPPGFFVHFGENYLQKGVYAVVESAQYVPEPEDEKNPKIRQKLLDDRGRKSELFRPLSKDINGGPVFYLADVESIVAPTCVIPDLGNEDVVRYLQVTPRKEWPQLYIKWLMATHIEDTANMESSDDESDE